MKIKFTLLFAIGSIMPCVAQVSLDSLNGFDEAAIRSIGVSERLNDQDLVRFIEREKKTYVRQKYFYSPSSPMQRVQPINPGCLNEDFEASSGAVLTSTGQIVGWVATGSSSNIALGSSNNCNLFGCCPTTPSASILISDTSGFIDPFIGPQYPIFSVFGDSITSSIAASFNPQLPIQMRGTNFIKLNNSIRNEKSAEAIETSFSVTAANSLLAYAFMAVVELQHPCCDAAAFQVIIRNLTTNTVIPGGVYFAGVPAYTTATNYYCNNNLGMPIYDANTGLLATLGSGAWIQFSKWKVVYVDLSPYIGQVVQVQAIAGDCYSGAHVGTGYFDSKCGAKAMLVTTNVQSSFCLRTATVSANNSLNIYNWSGPNGFTNTAASFTTQVSGVYTLEIPQGNAFPTIQQTVNVSFQAPTLSLSTSNTLVCQGDVVTLNASGFSTYTWSTGSTGSSTTVQALSYGTYTVKGTDALGCQKIDSIVVSVKPCTGIEEQRMLERHLLFPNPGQSPFTLESPFSALATLRVYDALGQLVHEQTIVPGKNEIYLSEVKNGIFFYQLDSEKGISMRGKLAVQ